MKKVFFFILAVLTYGFSTAQNKSLPAVQVKTLEGQTVALQDWVKNGKITVISLWATWCSPCKKELDAIEELYSDWEKNYDVELIALSIDDARTQAKVAATVAEKKWPYHILLDPAKEFYNAANIPSVPYTLLIDRAGKVVYEHTGYAPGDELELEEKIKTIARN